LNGVYTQRYNRKMKIDGALFRGRYKAQLIEEDNYLLVVSRYIHLNPVKARITVNPADYQWSSYSSYLNKQKKPDWLTTGIILNLLKNTALLSHIYHYQDYVELRAMDEINIFS